MKILMVELTNHCNEDCWFCPNSKMVREKGFMSMDTVKHVISKIEPGSSVVLNNLGESLLHPQFFEIAEMFVDAGIGTMVTVNGCCLDKELVANLLESKISNVRISIDFITKDIETIVEPLLDDHRFIMNIKGVDRDSIVKFREKYGDKGCITYLVDFAGQMNFKSDFSASRDCTFLNDDKCVILWNGKVCACCYDYEGTNILGTIDELDNMNHRDYDLCKNCNGLDLRIV